jgi:arsenate reductase
MHFKKDELTLLYNSHNPRDMKTLAMAKTISLKINMQDINDVDVSATLFEVAVEALGGDPKMLINKSLPYYQQSLRGTEYSILMWFRTIKKMPELLKAPIAFYKDRVVLCETPTDILKVNSGVAV